MAKILSTLTSSFVFVLYNEAPAGQLPTAKRRIRIAGGANTPSNKGFGEMTSDEKGNPIWTPRGMVTTVDDEDMKWLSEERTFKAFEDAGLIQVLSEKGAEFEHNHKLLSREVEDNMTPVDSHAPIQGMDDKRVSAKIKVNTGSLDTFDN